MVNAMQSVQTAQYYASYNPNIPDPKPIAAWYDSISRPDLDYTKPGFLQLTDAQWAARGDKDYAVQNGSLVDYSPPVVAVPLITQATNAKTWIQQQANLAAAMGEVFTADMKAYVRATAAIASVTDTTRTVPPAQPTSFIASF